MTLGGTSVSTVSARMRFFLRLRHNAFSLPGLQSFRLRSHSIVASQSGPVSSRFDRFLLIGLRDKRGPTLRLLNNANLHFLSMLLVQCRRGAQCFFRCFERPNRFSNFLQRCLKIQYKLAVLPHQRRPKPCFTIVSDETL